MEFDPVSVAFIDTPQFQRLRDLKQLGISSYVYPGATHTRFEHSLGVGYLAGKMASKFKDEQKDLEITDQDVLCVKLAGLCHDLGHGPFSHVFDGVFIPTAKPGCTWTHERGSEMMFDAAMAGNGSDLTTDEVKFIKDLIAGEPRNQVAQSDKKYLYEIVANHRNSVDVDKFDYIPRDCYYTGVKQSYDTNRLINFARVVNNQICFNQKEVYNIYEMFHARYTLHRTVYSHKVAKAIEFMIVDVLIAADEVLNLSDVLEDPEQYTLLTDSIIKEIERSKDPRLEVSRSIIKRIRRRDLYDFVDQMIIPRAYRKFMTKQKVTKENILKYQEVGANLKETDIILDWLLLTYAMKDRNPVDNILFFNKYKPDEVYTINRKQVSLLIPEHYDECTIRIFSKDCHNSTKVQKAFRNFMEATKKEFNILYERGEMEVADDSFLQMSLNADRAPNSAVTNPYTTPTKARPSNRVAALASSSNENGEWGILTPNRGLTLPDDYSRRAQSPLKRNRNE